MTFLEILKVIMAVGTIATGLISLIRPRAVQGFTGLSAPGPRGITEIRSILGGGFVGLDRFYLGYRSLGMLKLFTFGMFGIWVVLDIIQLILNTLKDCDGKPLIQD